MYDLFVLFGVFGVCGCIILHKYNKLKYLESFNIILTTVFGTYGINHLYNEKSYWSYVSNLIFKKNITYKNDGLLTSLKGGHIIVSNHINATDMTLIRSKIDCYALSKQDLFSTDYKYVNSINEILMNNLKLVPYKRGCVESGHVVKYKIMSITKNGENILVFPEGGCQLSCHNGMVPFKPGLFHTAKQYNIPILPVVIYYTNNNYGMKTGLKNFSIIDLLNDTNVIIKFIKPIIPTQYDDAQHLMDSVYNTMNKKLLKLHKQSMNNA